MKKIERARSGHQCKEEGKSINNFKKAEWEKKASDLCKPGIRQKFIENKVPRTVLLQKTSGKRIVECTKETPWGCGLALKDENCLITTKWTSQGIMGVMLEEIRQELMDLSKSTSSNTTTPTIQPIPDAITDGKINTIQVAKANQRTGEQETTASSDSSSSDNEMQS